MYDSVSFEPRVRTMGTIRSLRMMMQITPLMKMIINLCKQDRLGA